MARIPHAVVHHRPWLLHDAHAQWATAAALGRGRRPSRGIRRAVFAVACLLADHLSLAGQLGARFGMPAAFAALAVVTVIGVALAWKLWPQDDEDEIGHEHPEDPAWDQHLKEGMPLGKRKHSHVFAIDDLHPRWPDAH